MSGRALRTCAAVAVAGSLLGVQALTPTANAASGDPVTWRPGEAAPTGTGFWSNACPSAKTGIPNDSSNLHSKLVDDQKSIAGSLRMAPENGADVGWQYAPASGVEAGPSFTITDPANTQSIGAQVQGATSGQAIVFYQATGASDYYVGIAPLSSTGTNWGPVTATTFAWYHWNPPSSGVLGTTPGSWNALYAPFLSSTPTPQTIGYFATNGPNGSGNNSKAMPAGNWYASIELGCTGAFAIDHLQVTGGLTNAVTTSYDLQNPTTTTTATSSTGTVGPGGSATITAAVTSGSASVTEGSVTLWSSNDGGATWAQQGDPTTGRTFAVSPTQNTQYEVSFNGTTNYAATSNAQLSSAKRITVQVAPTLALSADRSITNVRTTATFTAKFLPARQDVLITFQQKVGKAWKTMGTADTDSTGVAVFTGSQTASGVWNVRATAPVQAGLLGTNTPATSIKVYQPVTVPISASPRSLYVGGTIRIKGALKQRLRGVPLRLQQRVGKRWVVLARANSGPHGRYTFSRRANSAGTATFRVVAPASGYRRGAISGAASVRIRVRPRPVYTPPAYTPPAYTPPSYTPPSGGGSSSGGGGSNSGGGGGNGIG